MIKRIEDWTYYELLNVERTASPEEIREGYQAALVTYAPGSLAAYSLVTDDERRQIVGRIEEACQTLLDPERKQTYDLSLLKRSYYYAPKAPFRRTVGKLEIDEAPSKRGLWQRLRRLFSRPKRMIGPD
ncbi:MAG TPA: DnaJ domain-containing protein [Terriglobales bacterium]|nr:DnaJ domain-containing protein [Terriglobales bacterium]